MQGSNFVSVIGRACTCLHAAPLGQCCVRPASLDWPAVSIVWFYRNLCIVPFKALLVSFCSVFCWFPACEYILFCPVYVEFYPVYTVFICM